MTCPSSAKIKTSEHTKTPVSSCEETGVCYPQCFELFVSQYRHLYVRLLSSER